MNTIKYKIMEGIIIEVWRGGATGPNEWRRVIGVMCDKRMSEITKGKVYKMVYTNA